MKTEIKIYPSLLALEKQLRKIIDTFFNDPSILKNNSHVDFKYKNFDNNRFLKLNSYPAIDEHLTAKCYVDQSMDGPTLDRKIKESDLKSFNLTIMNISLYTQAVNDNQVITNSYVGQFHSDNERNWRDLGVDFYNESSVSIKNNQDNDPNNKKLANLDSITNNREPISDNELSNKENWWWIR